MPKKCAACRADERREAEPRLRREKRKLSDDAERPPLRHGLSGRIHLPRVLGVVRRHSGDWNMEDFRRDWRAEIDAIFGNVDEDRRDQW